jgi:hypothetical protein
VKYLQAYDSHLKRLGQSGAQKPGIAAVGFGPILLVTIPFGVATVIVTATFAALGWTGPLGTTLKLLISLALLVALFYSGFRVVHYRAQSRKDK